LLEFNNLNRTKIQEKANFYNYFFNIVFIIEFYYFIKIDSILFWQTFPKPTNLNEFLKLMISLCILELEEVK